jgi:hypothetical protein
MTTEHTVVSFRQIKKKAVQFSGRLLANYRDLCLQLPPSLGGTEGGSFGYRALSLMERK